MKRLSDWPMAACSVVDHPVLALGFLFRAGGHLADTLRELDAGVLAEAEALGVIRERVDAELVADSVEVVVARNLDRLGGVDVAMAARIDPALRGVVRLRTWRTLLNLPLS